MPKTIATIAAVATLLLAPGCSRPTGIAQVDRARATLDQRLHLDPSLDEIGDAATTAVERADGAGRSGNIAEMAHAVGKGTGEVLCAGVKATGPARRQIGRTAVRELGADQATRPLRDTYEQAVGALADMPNPCRTD